MSHMPASPGVTTVLGAAVTTKAGIPTDADFTAPTDGIVVIDTTHSKIYVRVGGAWKSVTVA